MNNIVLLGICHVLGGKAFSENNEVAEVEGDIFFQPSIVVSYINVNVLYKVTIIWTYVFFVMTHEK